MTRLLVIGGAGGVWRDIEAANAIGRYDAVLGINDIIAEYPGRLDYVVSLHAEKVPGWLKRRTANGHPGRPIFWAHDSRQIKKGHRTPEHIARVDWGGSSGLFAIKVGLLEGFARIVLAGVPMDGAQAHFFDKEPWKGARLHWANWERRRVMLRQFVRSVSGNTMTLLGAPTAAWLGDSAGLGPVSEEARRAGASD